MSNILIKKVEVREADIVINYFKEETRQGHTESVGTKRKYKFNAHDELKEALKALIPHFVQITEQNQGKGELTDSFNVTGFEVKNSGQNQGVILFGVRKLKDGRTVNFKTPFVNFDIEISDYEDLQDLIDSVEVAKAESIEYINGKFESKGTQANMFDKSEETPVKKLSGKAKKEQEDKAA